MADLLHVEPRTHLGKRHNRRLRRSGRLPAVLYGHGQQAQSLSLSGEELDGLLRHGAKVVDLAGAASGKALVHDVQWDTFLHDVLHVDLLHVVAGETVTVEVPIEFKGEAPGSREGGVLEHLIHSVEIEVPLDQVPEKLHVNVNHLELDGELLIRDITDLPSGAKVLAEPEEVVVRCEKQMVAEEEETPAEAASTEEPEVIAKGKEEEADDKDKE